MNDRSLPRKPSNTQPISDFNLDGFIAAETKVVSRKIEAPGTPASRPTQQPRVRVQIHDNDMEPPAPHADRASYQQASPSVEDSAFAPPPNFDSRFQSEGLPSNFHFYKFKSLHMRPLVPRDQFLIYRSRNDGSVTHIVDAISSTIGQDAYELSVGDFWYLMYQQRLKSFKRAPFNVGPWTCIDDKHLDKIQKAEEAVAELSKSEDATDEERKAAEVEVDRLYKSQKQETIVSRSDLEVKELTPETVEAMNEIRERVFNETGLVLVVPTMRSFTEILEERDTLVSRIEAELDKEEHLQNAKLIDQLGKQADFLDFMNRYAGCIDVRHGTTIKERRLVVDQQDYPELLNDIDEFLTLSEHGVTEFFNCKCKECGSTSRVKQTIDLPHFFPRYNG